MVLKLLELISACPLPYRTVQTDNYVHDNADAGIALMESFGADIHDNVIENCQYGIRLSVGSANNNIYDNSFDSCSDCKDVIRSCS